MLVYKGSHFLNVKNLDGNGTSRNRILFGMSPIQDLEDFLTPNKFDSFIFQLP